MKKMLVKILLSGIAVLSIVGCETADNGIEEIKKGYLNACPDYSIEELINNYMGNPKWSKEKSDRGYYVYNVSGKINYKNEESNALIQFAIDNDNIVVRGFEINKVPQDNLTYATLVTNMCETTKELKKNEEYKDWVTNKRDKWLKEQEEKLKNIPDGYVLFYMSVTEADTYGNSIKPGDYVDLYDKKAHIIAEEKVQVLEVIDSDGNYVFEPYAESRCPAQLILIVPKRYKESIEYFDLIPVPSGYIKEN